MIDRLLLILIALAVVPTTWFISIALVIISCVTLLALGYFGWQFYKKYWRVK